jgi:hypothetical protein
MLPPEMLLIGSNQELMSTGKIPESGFSLGYSGRPSRNKKRARPLPISHNWCAECALSSVVLPLNRGGAHPATHLWNQTPSASLVICLRRTA